MPGGSYTFFIRDFEIYSFINSYFIFGIKKGVFLNKGKNIVYCDIFPSVEKKDAGRQPLRRNGFEEMPLDLLELWLQQKSVRQGGN